MSPSCVTWKKCSTLSMSILNTEIFYASCGTTLSRMAENLRIIISYRSGPLKHERSLKALQLKTKGTNSAKCTH